MRLSIRTKLALLVLAVLLPLLAAAAVRFWGDMSEGRRVGNQSQLDTANLIAGRLDEILTGQIESLLALASLRSLDSVQDADLETLAGRVRERHPFMRRFVAVSPDGRVVATSGYRDGDPKFLTPEAIATVLGRGEPVVTMPHTSGSDSRQVVAMVVPVQDPQGKLVGAIGAEVDLETLSRYLNTLPLGREQTVAVVSTNGDVLARSVSPHEFFTRSLSGRPEADALLRRGEGSAEWAAEDGVAHLAGAASMTRAPWVVVAAMPSGAASARSAPSCRGRGISRPIRARQSWCPPRTSWRSWPISSIARSVSAGRPMPSSTSASADSAPSPMSTSRCPSSSSSSHSSGRSLRPSPNSRVRARWCSGKWTRRAGSSCAGRGPRTPPSPSTRCQCPSASMPVESAWSHGAGGRSSLKT